ncbi:MULTISPECIES: hypothetical protein [unclassified Streptomyces]|uniref:hypothetical protein n=1 Tax=unclassified Streptomyces TaxID=2593676 RepID=UPI0034184246
MPPEERECSKPAAARPQRIPEKVVRGGGQEAAEVEERGQLLEASAYAITLAEVRG